MLHVGMWYLALSLAGLLALPWAWWLFRHLTTRGVFFARTLGWLAWGYGFWLAGSLGLLRISPASAWAMLTPVAALSLALLAPAERRRAFGQWLRAHWTLWLRAEGLFAFSFAAWALVRAANPQILGTEKPMELAFINAILTSPRFPPHDPWLAGYAIAYYYFGYVLTALLALASATPGPVAFNLGLTTVFALAVTGAYGLTLDLIVRPGERESAAARVAALLGPVFAFLVGNWEGALEVLHRKGFLWTRTADGWSSPFWRWLAIQNLENPPVADFSGWMPPRHWWWWRASRVIRDTTLAGGHQEVIDEFPFFSFILGDLHPHVLALPVVLLAVALALELYRATLETAPVSPPARLFRDPLQALLAWGQATVEVIRSLPWWVWPWVFGAAAFLNAWDYPLALGINAAALYLALVDRGWPWRRAAAVVGLWIGASAGLGMLLYLPYSWSFDSQAKGLLPNVVNPSRGAQLWVMFGPLWVPLFGWLGWVAWRTCRKRGCHAWRWAATLTLGVTLALALLSWLQAWFITVAFPLIAKQGALAAQAYLNTYAARDFFHLLQEGLRRQALAIAGTGFLVLLATLAGGYLRAQTPRASTARAEHDRTVAGAAQPAGGRFAALLALWAAGLVLFPNFFYLWDNFGTRMNTVFKFYYQAWVLGALAAAYATWAWRAWWGRALVALGLLAGGVYTGFALVDRVHGVPLERWTLDGSAWLQRSAPGDWAAIQAIRARPLGVVLEADGGSYSEYARISTYTGYPTVLGWPGHEAQWRGGSEEIGTRPQDIRILYTERRWDVLQGLLDQYHIRYIVVGDLERRKFPRAGQGFEGRLPVLVDVDGTRVYLYDPTQP
ncbi:MAG: hypothetical protein GXO36_03790 [Chloroflexi bacterium]|nr:hypothetical protein [Chloroflexota bacterium]